MDALPCREPAFGVLAVDGLGATALTNFFFFVSYLRHQVSHESHVRFKFCRSGVDLGRQLGRSGVRFGDLITVGHGSITANELRYTSRAGRRKPEFLRNSETKLKPQRPQRITEVIRDLSLNFPRGRRFADLFDSTNCLGYRV